MFCVELAGVTVEIDNRYNHIEQYCRGWESEKAPAFRVRVTDSEIVAYMKGCGMPMTEDLAERILVYRKICAELTRLNIFLLHGAVISYRGQGIIFIADRGVGKTTHAELWKRAFGDDVSFVNGDKPLIRKEGDRYFAYGTPWRGKEGLGENAKVPLRAICYLGRGDKPFATRIRPEEALMYTVRQTIYPEDRELYDSFADGIAELLKNTPTFAARVDMTLRSAECVRDVIFNM